MTPTSTAIHEAGHAIVAMALGLEMGVVTIVPDAENNRAGSSCNEPGDSPVDEATVYFAGWEAERLLDPAAAALSRWASSSDEEAAAELLRGAGASDEESQCREMARRLLVWQWAKVYAVALDLDYWRSLEPDEINSHFDAVDHSDLANELAEWRVRSPRHAVTAEHQSQESERLLTLLSVASAAARPAP